MKKFLVLFTVVLVMIATATFANGISYLSDGNITVKVWQKDIADHLRLSGWKEIATTDKIDVEVANYGPEDNDPLVTKDCVIVYPISGNPMDREHAASLYQYDKGYEEKVAKRLAKISAYLKK